MRIFIYEWVCGGGFLGRADTAPDSLLDEGAAMLRAVIEDFERINDVTVSTTVDASLAARFSFGGEHELVKSSEEHSAAFDDLAANCDRTVVIAPEFEGVLLGLSNRVLDVGGTLISPGPDFVEVTSDKYETANLLHSKGVRTTLGRVVMPGEMCPAEFDYPAVLKPADGAGSLGVVRLDSPRPASEDAACYVLEPFVPGQPASVAALCGNGRIQMLEPTMQRIALDGDFAYLGGALPLEEDLRLRASSVGQQAIAALPDTQGYVGVDMILGAATDGSEDYVVEVNPRYTVSYVGLRAATDDNLAALLMQLTNGEPVSTPHFARDVQWVAAGAIRQL